MRGLWKCVIFLFFAAQGCGISLWGQEPAVSESEGEPGGSPIGDGEGRHGQFGGTEAAGQGNVVMFWNLENFYDYIDQGTGESDAEFSSRGANHWTKARFFAKCDAIAKMILWVGDRYGSPPSVVGFAEVENGWAVRQIVGSTALRKFGYKVVHYDSPDHRGIDVALIYREEVYELLSSKPCHIYVGGGGTGGNGFSEGAGAALDAARVMHTRDILLVTLRDRRSGEVTHFAVNHHPSKYGGEAASRPARLAAMTRLKFICDSLRAHDAGTRIVAMGDFNDTPDNPLFGIFGDTMVNKALPLHRRGLGTIKYQGKWELIDMFIISSKMDLADAEKFVSGNERGDRKGCKVKDTCNYRMEIVQAPFHTQNDSAHVGEKPLRTYSGPRYIGGISDHFPIVLIPSQK